MKSQHRQVVRRESQEVRLRSLKTKSPKAPTLDAQLAALYARLDKTKPGSKESKEIADEIIDAIG
jgi:hypothetical protein